MCFHTQQAAEKAIKAVYKLHGWSFRYTHDLEELLTGLKWHEIKIPSEGEPVTIEEYREAFGQAETVVAWAEKEIQHFV